MNFLSEEEQKLLTNYALLPFVLIVFRQDTQMIENSGMRVKEPYFQLLTQAIHATEQQLWQTRKTLRLKGVHIYKDSRTDIGVEIHYLYKGYHHKSEFKWEYVKSHLKALMSHFLKSGMLG